VGCRLVGFWGVFGGLVPRGDTSDLPAPKSNLATAAGGKESKSTTSARQSLVQRNLNTEGGVKNQDAKIKKVGPVSYAKEGKKNKKKGRINERAKSTGSNQTDEN